MMSNQEYHHWKQEQRAIEISESIVSSQVEDFVEIQDYENEL